MYHLLEYWCMANDLSKAAGTAVAYLHLILEIILLKVRLKYNHYQCYVHLLVIEMVYRLSEYNQRS
ncbi:hypothetical protein D3C73_782040 [compost metagenome]